MIFGSMRFRGTEGGVRSDGGTTPTMFIRGINEAFTSALTLAHESGGW